MTTADEPLERDASASDYVAEKTFAELSLSDEVLRALADKGYETPTPVQAAVIEPAIAGKDLIVRSKTGTGKTAAFGVPLVERITGGKGVPQAIVLCPTRELAIQVCEEITEIAQHKDLETLAIYGGASMQKQIDALKRGVDLVAGTPGRVLDHIRRGNLDLSQVMIRVLDEADEMLSMGFFEEVATILDATPPDAQMLLFSATVSEDIEELIADFSHDPEMVLLSGDEFSVDGIENILYETREDQPKPRSLLYLLEAEDPPAALIFCNTRQDTEMVTAVLNKHGLDAALINSDLSQRERERVMGKIKQGRLRFLVATDLAARGIDISDVTHVINYSLPQDPSVYMHRVGRTGRMGKAGRAISLFSGRDLHTLKALETEYGVDFDRRVLPDAQEARKSWAERHIREMREDMEGNVFEAFIPLAQELKERPDGEYLLAFALKMYFTAKRAGSVEPRQEKKEGRDSGPRRERGERGGRDRGPRSDAAPGTRLWVNLGSGGGHDQSSVREKIVAAIEGDATLVANVDVYERHSFVDAKDASAAEALLAAHGIVHDDHTFKVEVAKAPSSKRRRRRRN